MSVKCSNSSIITATSVGTARCCWCCWSNEEDDGYRLGSKVEEEEEKDGDEEDISNAAIRDLAVEIVSVSSGIDVKAVDIGADLDLDDVDLFAECDGWR